jgi:hypothetical protein
MCDGDAVLRRDLLEAPHLEDRLGWAVVVVVWWCCLRAATDEVRLVRVSGKVQRDHGTRGLELVRLVVCSMASAGRRCCSLGGFSGI